MEQHLDFEQPIYTCLEKIEELKKIIPEPENLHEEIAILEKQSKKEQNESIALCLHGKKCLSHAIQTDRIPLIIWQMSLMALRKYMAID